MTVKRSFMVTVVGTWIYSRHRFKKKVLLLVEWLFCSVIKIRELVRALWKKIGQQIWFAWCRPKFLLMVFGLNWFTFCLNHSLFSAKLMIMRRHPLRENKSAISVRRTLIFNGDQFVFGFFFSEFRDETLETHMTDIYFLVDGIVSLSDLAYYCHHPNDAADFLSWE